MKSEQEKQFYNSESQTLAYADDVVLMSRTTTDLVRVLRLLKKGQEYGIHVNENKTKYLQTRVDTIYLDLKTVI